jgi:hypothetical protein
MADVSVREAAERPHTSDRNARRWIAEGKLTATRAVDGWVIAESDLDDRLTDRPSPDNGHSESVRPGVDHWAVRPSEARLLASIRAELVRTAAAAVMWQARAEHLQDQLERALPMPSESHQEAPTANGTVQVTTESQNGVDSGVPARACWRFWGA